MECPAEREKAVTKWKKVYGLKAYHPIAKDFAYSHYDENVNNIEVNHLHFGLQLIFDESQRDSDNEIWVSGYELTKFLQKHRCQVQRDEKTKEWTRVYQIKDPAVTEKKNK